MHHNGVRRDRGPEAGGRAAIADDVGVTADRPETFKGLGLLHDALEIEATEIGADADMRRVDVAVDIHFEGDRSFPDTEIERL